MVIYLTHHTGRIQNNRMRIYMKTLGCRLNEAELETWSREFQDHGHQLTPELEQADMVIVNSCAVTADAVRKSRKAMHRAHHKNPHAKLVVSGCYASLNPETTAQEMGVDLVIGNQDKDRLVKIVSRELDLKSMPQLATEPGVNSLLARGRQRAFIKVQDGCRYNCTFCIVTLARGEERSRPIADVVEEINRLHAEGIHEAVLTGVHIGGYGSDLNSSLTELIQAVLDQTDIPRLRIGAVEPWDLPDQFWPLFDNPRFLPHLHLPLQSGSDSILRRMARRCKRDEFAQLVDAARSSIHNFNITTDVIVGFPGEGESEWRESIEFIQQIGFGHLHIFTFSPRAGTLAADMPGRVPRETMRQRSQELHELGMRMKRDTLQQNLGQTCQVLIECLEQRPNQDGQVWSGYTPNFLRVAVPYTPGVALDNEIVTVRLESICDEGATLLGTITKV
jgi:threonylcarbamoyladenosine tRNA methylthiotransferase MtaB